MVDISVSKNSKPLRSFRAPLSGQYEIDVYSAGTYELLITAETGTLVEKKKLEATVTGNVPKTCPSRSVWVSGDAKIAEHKGAPGLSLLKLINNATLVIDGYIESIEFCPQTIKGSAQFSFVTLSIGEVVVGKYSGSKITLPFVGGVMDGVVQIVSGVPLFRQGERVVLFLGEGKLNPVVEGETGVFPIIPEGIVTSYEGLPMINLDSKTGSFHFDDSWGGKSRLIDPVYHIRMVNGAKGVSSRPLGTASGSTGESTAGQSVAIGQLIKTIKYLKSNFFPEDKPAGKILSAGTPFVFGPLKSAAPSIGTETLPKEENGTSVHDVTGESDL